MSIFKKIFDIEQDCDKFGFMWSNPHQILEQIISESKEVEETLQDPSKKAFLQEELGDLIHATFSLCVFLKFDPEETLMISIKKMEKRVGEVKRLAKEKGLDSLHGLPHATLMELWGEAKINVG